MLDATSLLENPPVKPGIDAEELYGRVDDSGEDRQSGEEDFVVEEEVESLQQSEAFAEKNEDIEETSEIEQMMMDDLDVHAQFVGEVEDSMVMGEDEEEAMPELEDAESSVDAKDDMKPQTMELTDNVEVPSFADKPQEVEKERSSGSTEETEWELIDKKDVPEHVEDEYMDVLGNGLLRKKILRKGEGRSSRPVHGQLLTLGVSSKLDDGTVVDDNDELTITMGDGDTVQAIDLCVALMEKDEISEIITDPKYAYGEIGLEPNVPKNANLTYTVELKDVMERIDYTKLSVRERTRLGDKKRERGNYYYARQEYAAAISSYSKALNILDDSIQTLDGEPAELQELLDTRIKCHNNLAAAQLKSGAYDAAIKSCESVLKHHPDNVKALFRKGKALAAKGEINEAVVILKKALKLEPDSKTIHQELSRLTNLQKAQDDKEKVMYKKMMGDMGDIGAKPEPKQKSWLPMCGLVAGIIALAAIVVGFAMQGKSSP